HLHAASRSSFTGQVRAWRARMPVGDLVIVLLLVVALVPKLFHECVRHGLVDDVAALFAVSPGDESVADRTFAPIGNKLSRESVASLVHDHALSVVRTADKSRSQAVRPSPSSFFARFRLARASARPCLPRALLGSFHPSAGDS